MMPVRPLLADTLLLALLMGIAAYPCQGDPTALHHICTALEPDYYRVHCHKCGRAVRVGRRAGGQG